MKNTCCFPTSAMCYIGVYKIGWWAKGFIRQFCIVLFCFLRILHSIWFCCCSLSKWLSNRRNAEKKLHDCLLLCTTSVLLVWYLSLSPSARFVLLIVQCTCTLYIHQHVRISAHIYTSYCYLFIRRCLFVYSFIHLWAFYSLFRQSGNRFQSFSLSLLHEIDANKRSEKSKQGSQPLYSIHGANSFNKLLLW